VALYNSYIAKKIFPISSVRCKQEVLESKHLLKPGWYLINFPFTFRIGSKIPSSAEKLFKENFMRCDSLLWISRTIFSLLFGWLRVRKTRQDQSYDFLYFSSRGYVKYFDNDKMKITIDYKDEKIAKRTCRLYNSNLYLPLNETIHKDGALTEVNLIVGEPLILKKNLEESLAVYEEILNSFIKNIKKIKENGVHWDMEEAKNFFNLNLKTFTDSVQERVLKRRTQILKCLTKCPLIMTHGDLCASNIIVREKDYVVVDLEHAKLRHAFFDIISYPLNTVLLDEEFSLTVENVKSRYWQYFNEIIEDLISDESIEVQDLIYIFLMHRSNDGSAYQNELVEERLLSL